MQGNQQRVKLTMKTAIEKILATHGILEAFRDTNNYSVKIENEPFMMLCIEKHGRLIFLTHYYEQNGDLVGDPDMELVDLGFEDWAPIAIQHATGHYARAGECKEGEWYLNRKLFKDLEAFTRMWAKNLLDQGLNGLILSGRVLPEIA